MESLIFDLRGQGVRELNRFLHHDVNGQQLKVIVRNPDGAHSIAVGVDAPVEIVLDRS